jgi:cytochrome c553
VTRNLFRRCLIAAAVAALGGCQAPTPAADPFSATGRLLALSGGDSGAANACFTCHGLDGAGNGAGAPRLAGLDVGYLNRQLDDYANGRRRNKEMQAIALRLSRSDRQAVAAYYAALPFEPAPAPAAATATATVTGAALYHRGDPARGLAPCAACHGEAGEGVGPGNPPLAGQPAAYLAEQLRQWQRSERRNDPDNIMLRISRKLRAGEVTSVAAHAAALRPAPRESSRAARRGDPRNDASAPRRRAGE